MDNNELQERAEGIANRAKAIITKPAETWPVIAKETDDPMQVFLKYAVPLAAIGPICQFIGGQLFGYGAFGISFKPSLMGGISQMLLSYVLALVGLWLIAWVANFLSPKFGGKDNYASAFRLTAYAMTAAWVVGLVGLVPALGILGLLGLYSLYLFYKGASPMMDVPHEKAVGYTVVTVLIGIVVNMVFGFLAASMVGGAALGNIGAGDIEGDRTSIDLGDYGSIEVDGENQSIDLGDQGKIEFDAETGRATMEVDGQTVTVDVPTDSER